MEQMRHRGSKRSPLGRLATKVCAIGAVTASVFALGLAGVAGAQTAANGKISTTQNQKLGTILVAGKPVYTLKASSTACGTQCLKIWPQVALPKGMTKAKAGNGVTASKLGTVKRSGGVLQVTYGGKPLYYFVGDTTAASVNGNITDKWGKWSTVVTKPSASGSTATTSGGSNAGTGGASF
jgi:predicted lipoprotein with Yx(FWY)xxD motif